MRTDMHSIAKGSAALLLLASLTACGGGGSFSTGGGATNGGGGGIVSPTTVLIGSGTSGSFARGVLDIGSSSLSAGGSTSITVNIQKGDGSAFTDSISITFISPCFQGNLAKFTDSTGATTNIVSTSTGQATITYTATGCSGSDIITASATDPNGGADLTATGTVTVASAKLGSIEWVSTSNNSEIALAGSGGNETATVVFKVTDTTGGPEANQKVTFKLETTTGGITFTPASAVSGTDGLVSTIVHSGTEHGSARVKATTTKSGVTISTVSPGIVVSTGIPTQDKFSLFLSVHNVEGYNFDGATSSVSVAMADRFANPVADGTTVSFTANGGHIQPSCTTTASTGGCTVTWTSHNPRPSGVIDPSVPPSVLGHAEILAYTTGEEHFGDLDGDGVFDHTDTFNSLGGGDFDTFSWLINPTVDNIGEIYLDGNENGQYDNLEFFFDFNKDGNRNTPDGDYHGAGCTGTSSVNCGTSTTLSIGLQDCIVMSTTTVFIVADSLVLSGGTYTMNPGDTETFWVYDTNGNAPPAGMTFSVVSSGTSATVLQASVPDITCAASPPGIIPNPNLSGNNKGNGAYAITVSVPSAAQPGSFLIQATSPETSTISFSTTIIVP